MRWTTARMDQLERAIRDGLRISLMRRGSEHIVIARRLTSVNSRDAVVGMVPMTGAELTFVLDDLDDFFLLS
jgi:hypothetical protein